MTVHYEEDEEVTGALSYDDKDVLSEVKKAIDGSQASVKSMKCTPVWILEKSLAA